MIDYYSVFEGSMLFGIEYIPNSEPGNGLPKFWPIGLTYTYLIRLKINPSKLHLAVL